MGALVALNQRAGYYINTRVPEMARYAFSKGGAAIGRFFNQFKDEIPRYVRELLRLVPDIQHLENRVLEGFSRIPDFWLKIRNFQTLLEGKYQLPRAGEALTRFASQLQQFASWASQGTGREVVVWALKRPENIARAERIVLEAARVKNVRFLYGVNDLFMYLLELAKR